VPVIRILYLVIKSVVQTQSIFEEKKHRFKSNFHCCFSPPITYSMFKRIELPVPKESQEA
jgi:hypothetical protein